MLRVLELRDFAIVASLTLDLGPGLNVLSGETGAGKSILVDALTLLAGGRPDAGQIRAGATAALVQGEFEGEQVASAARRLAVNGRHAARLDGELVTVSELAAKTASLIAVYSQGSAQELQSPAAQRARLDGLLSTKHRAVLAQHAEAFQRLAEANHELAALRAREREAARLFDSLSHQLAEIDAATLTVGEEEELAAELGQLEHAERVINAAAAASSALSGEEPGAVALVAAAARELAVAARHAPSLKALHAELEEALVGLGAIASEVERFLASFELDPARLDAVQARLAAIERLKRKYGDDVIAVLAFREEVARQLGAIADLEDDILHLERETEELTHATAQLADELSAARSEAADRLALAMTPLLAELGLPRARFSAALEPAPRPHAAGNDRVRFVFSANPGEPLGDLAEVASGGELSRLMLALHLVTGADHPTLVFDEVDAGVGGATANAVGRLLKRLSVGRQVLVVTHLAQVAAFADEHFVVDKGEEGGRTVATVRHLDTSERPQELARMLSGKITEASLRHAAELMATAEHIN